MLGRKGAALCLLVWASLTLLLPSVGLAADGGGYLAGYENQDPMPNGTPGVSWWSTIAYVASLVVVFLFVAGLAYYVSKILGGRFGRAVSGGGRVLENLPLGPGRSACIVELAGRLLLLGVTEHSITLLGEIEDPAEAEQILKRNLEGRSQDSFPGMSGFESQIGSLDQLAKRIPTIFKNDAFRK